MLYSRILYRYVQRVYIIPADLLLEVRVVNDTFYVDGTPFEIKGIGYSPVPAGDGMLFSKTP